MAAIATSAAPTTYKPPLFLFTDESPDADSLAETNLTLLCLDYLRDLRRSYTPTELWEAEGMDADFLSLAVWALSRVFVRPGKLRFDAARIVKMKDEKEERTLFGGGGMGEEPSFGNDPMYKSMNGDGTAANEWNTRAEIRSIRDEIDSGFYLTENIVIPKMEDIVNEVLLQPKHSSSYGQTQHTAPLYEYNDAHSSNAHRYYLLNGLASGGGGSDDKLAPENPSNNPISPRSQQLALALHGGPLTFGEIVHAGITSLGARTRIQAEREMVFHNPLFEQFVRAVGSKGFFSEKRKDEKRKSSDAAPVVDQAFLTPEEEQRRARVVYEEKYRKVVNKFRSKLAAKAETNQPRPNAQQFQQHGIMHPQQYQIQQHTQQQYHQYGYHQSNMMRNQYNVPQSMNASVASVADLQRKKREATIERVRAGGRDGYALNQERGRLQQQINYQQQHQQVQMQMQQNQQVQQHHQQTYQPLHQVQLRQSPPRLPTPSRQLHQPQPQPQQQQQQQLPPPVLTHQKPPPGQWETPKSRKHWPDSTKSTLRTKFNFDSHASPFDKSATTNTKPPTPPRSNRSQSPSILKQTALIPEPQPTPRLHEPNDQDELNQHEAEQLNAEGNQLMQKKQFQDALKSYSAALELCPGGPNSHVYYSNRSAAYLSLNDHVNSIRDSESSLELCPDYSKAHSRLGLAYFVSGQYEQAVEAYSIALKYEPDNEWNRSHYEKARKKVSKSQRKSLQERPFDEEPVHTNNTNNDESQEVGDDPAARSAEYIAMREADQYKDAGNAHMSNKEYEEALEKYSQAITISPAGPNSHVYYSNRAAAYCYLGQYDAAADDCMTSIEIKPDYEKAHARLGLSMFFLEDFEGAIEAYGRALELDPNNAASKSYLGKARKRLEELVEAENERKSKIANVFLEQQEELQKAMEEQLKMQGHGSERDSWS